MASLLVCTTLPKTTLSMSSGFTPACAMAALAACTPRSVAETSLSEPPYVPNGVRLADRKTRSAGIGFIGRLRCRGAEHNHSGGSALRRWRGRSSAQAGDDLGRDV